MSKIAMRPDVWMFFASAALTRTADPENHVKSCTDAGKFADEMCLQFNDRFNKDEDDFDYPLNPVFDHVPGEGVVPRHRRGSQDSSFRSHRSQVDKNLEDSKVSRRELDSELKETDKKIADLASQQSAEANLAEIERLKSSLEKSVSSRVDGNVDEFNNKNPQEILPPGVSRANNPTGPTSPEVAVPSNVVKASEAQTTRHPTQPPANDKKHR